jgi:hypothetical protein
MIRHTHTMLALAGAVLLMACDAPERAELAARDAEDRAEAAAPPAAEQAKPAATPAAGTAQAPSAAPAKFVPPLRGQVELGFTKPVTKRTKNEIITEIKVKNLSTTGSIAGLKVDEYWYDKGGNPVTGDTFRHRKPLLPGEVITITLRTPFNEKMHSNNYNFSHANGTIKTKSMPKL